MGSLRLVRAVSPASHRNRLTPSCRDWPCALIVNSSASQQTTTESSTAPARPTLNLPADPITRDHRARPSLRHVSNPTPRVVWRQASETSGTCLEPADRPSTDPHSWAGRRLWVRGRAGRERLSLGLNHNSPSQSSISQFPIVHREQVNRPQPSINLDL